MLIIRIISRDGVCGVRSGLQGALLYLLSSLIGSPLFASEVVLQDIKLNATDKKTIIDIDFGLPLNYVKHFPQSSGEILQVQLSLDAGKERSIHKEVRQGSDLRPPPGLEPILVYVTYEEGVPGGPYLTLRFSHRVDFKVTPGKTLTSLSIELSNVGLNVTGPVTPAPVTVLEEPLMQPGEIGAPKPEPADEGIPTDAESTQSGSTAPTQEADDADELMAKARQALTFGDNTGAIELLRKIIRLPENTHTQDARELLGLGLERSNQIPRAKFEYKKYLQQYKEGAGPDRVRQRLLALRNVGIEQRPKLRQTRQSTAGDNFRIFGRWSQAYDMRTVLRDALNDDDQISPEDFLVSKRITSNLNIRGRYSDADTVFQTVLATNHTYDFIYSDYSDWRTSDLHVDYEDLKQGYSAVLGRQRAQNSGVFDRFDGLQVGYKINEWMVPAIVVGEPVQTYDAPYSKKFMAAKIDIGQRKSTWAGHMYYTQQDVDGLNDRRAFGGGLRYSTKTLSLFGIADYDLLFEQLGLLNLRLGLQLSEKLRMNFSYNEGALVYLSTVFNGLGLIRPDIGINPDPRPTLPLLDMEQLSAIFTEAELREIAKDRVSRSSSATLGGAYQINKDQQFTMDVTSFESTGTNTRNFSSTDAIVGGIYESVYGPNVTLGEIVGSPATGAQYTYSAQWISSNTFAEQDLYLVGLRYSDFANYEEATIFLNTRLPNLDKWSPRPRLSYSQRNYGTCALPIGSSATECFPKGTRESIALSLKVDYRWKRKWVLDMELGGEWISLSDPQPNTGSGDQVQKTARIGYSYTF